MKEVIVLEPVSDERPLFNSWSGRKEEPMQFDSKRAFERLNQKLEEEGLKQNKIEVVGVKKNTQEPYMLVSVKAVAALAFFASIAIVAYMLWG